MSQLVNFKPTATNFYAEQAVEATPVNYATLAPGYYDHLGASLAKGIFEFARPVKNAESIEPFQPSNSFTLRSTSGEHITHAFVGLEATIVGYFIGAALSNYEQTLPNERKGAHCETSQAVLDLGDGKTSTINGRYPLQTSMGIHYNFRAYNKDPEAPGTYNGKRFVTSGRATPEYAKQAGRPEVMSCMDCLAANKDRYLKSKCRTTGQIAVYVTRVAIKGPEDKLVWLDVKELGIAELGAGFIAVFKVGASDLRKPDVSLTTRENFHIPPNATFAHDYITGLYRKNEPSLAVAFETELGLMQTLAYKTQMWVAELATSYGANKHTVLYNQVPGLDQLSLEHRHTELQEGLNAYFNERELQQANRNANANAEQADLNLIDAEVAAPAFAGSNVTSVPEATSSLTNLSAAASLFDGFKVS